jgi:4-amino-4-deoxy-L-arabinose transferase-like glycosyltransferase
MFMNMSLQRTKSFLVSGLSEPQGILSAMTPGLVLLVGLCLGLAARAWVLSQTVFQSYAVDELFDALAWNLVTNGFFSLDGTAPASHVGPLYPAILALFYSLVGHHAAWVPYLNMGMDVMTAFCIFRGASLLFGSTIGGIAAAVMFLYPAYWTYDVRIRNECLLTMLVAAWVWAAIACAKDTAVWRYAVMGVVAGTAALCKPVVLPAAGLLCFAVFLWSCSWRNGCIRLLVFTMCLMMVIAPWTIRNYRQFGQFIPVSSGFGAGLWMGSDPLTRGSWPMQEAEERQIWETAGIAPLAYPHIVYEAQTDRRLRELGWARIREHPWVYLRLTMTRVFDFWIGNRYYLLNTEATVAEGLSKDIRERGFVVGLYSLSKRLLLVPALMVLALWGAWRIREQWKASLPLFMIPLGVMLGYVPFTMESGRYALAVLPCVLILAVAGVVSWIMSRKNSRETPHHGRLMWGQRSS